MSEILLEAKSISKEFVKESSGKIQDIKVFDDISLDLYAGKSISIMGRSGAGKSTLINILGTLELPSTGDIFFHGKKIDFNNSSEIDSLRKNKIGFVFQFHHLVQELSALENVALRLRIKGLSNHAAMEKAKKELELVGLGDRLEHRPSELSGGEQQRVCLARTFAGEPDLILADEPTGNLDTENAEIIESLFLKLVKEKNIALCLVTHDLKLARRCDSRFVLEKGKLREEI